MSKHFEEHSVGILMGPTLPGAVRIAEVDRNAGGHDEPDGVNPISLPWSQVVLRNSSLGSVVIPGAAPRSVSQARE